MNKLNLKTIKVNEKVIPVSDSREVALKTGKEHSKLLRDIRGYIEHLNEANFGLVDFFIEDTYLDSKGEERPCYQLTKQGCEMVANKMTGKKGTLFTATYVQAFNKMEETIKSKSSNKSKSADNSLKEKEIEARYNNSLVRKANLLLKIAKDNPLITDEFKKVLQAKATEIITGQVILPLPIAERKTYSATEIGKELGISANKVGSLANKHNLKTDEYGKLFHDKSKYSNKEVESFRYYDNIIPVLAEILSN